MSRPRRTTGLAACATALALCAATEARASTQIEPLARIGLEGGYDSNVLYDGRGGDDVARVSPDLGLQFRNHTWTLGVLGGGDLLQYRDRRSDPVWNSRGRLALAARLEPRLTLESNLNATYAPDPFGLARLGIFGVTGSAFIGNGTARLTWRADHDWRVAGTFAEHLVRFGGGSGAASHTPGVEVTRRLGSERLDVGGAYRFDVFQGFGAGSHDAFAHELQGVLRNRLTRRVTLEAEAGPTLWTPRGPGAGSTQVIPAAMAQLLYAGRGKDARFTVRHGVGLGNLAVPGLFDSVEGAFRVMLGRSFEVRADGGLWRSGDIPWGANAVLGYGVEGEIAWLLSGGLRVGVGGSRFARADGGVTTFDRDTVGLRLAWELRHR